ncbi:hypothetical protein GLX27_001802 [Malassezia furfur]|uniref:Glutaredoxin-like protein n=1 Tax=Malassezia furfur TaxID=55194 RepID=A0ABY8EQB4_MALFU|nr:hypothetical protein CBS14141_003383 [Malassezia furfur]WFD47154.1 hypothetical protein GLX27_001802 [Malassezia furfur]
MWHARAIRLGVPWAPALRAGRVAAVRAPTALGSVRAYSHQPLPHITIFTGTQCQLCDEAKEVLDQIDAPFTVSTYNIHDDKEYNVDYWRRKYQYDIPVLHLRWDEDESHFGPEIGRHRITKSQIEDILAKGPQ